MVYWLAGTAFQSVLNGLWQGAVIMALAWAALRLARANAATRYAVWWAALAASALLPFAPALVRTAPRVAASSAAPASALVTLPAPSAWAVWLFAAWMLGAALMLGRVLWSYAYLQRVKRTATPLTGWHEERFAAMRAASGTARCVRAAWSGEIRVPIAAGIRHPAILLPDSLAENLSPEEFDQILAHEFAHLRRWDDWTNLAQKLIEAVFFFQPAVMWAGRKLNLEREIACDDWVIAAAGNTRSYAACLTKVVELSGFARTPQLAPGAGARKPQFSRRIESMLGRHMRLVNPRFSKVGICVCSMLVAAAAFGVMQFAPIAVAAPSVPALQAEFRLQHAPALGYAKPLSAPISVARAVRLAAKPASVVAKSVEPHALVDVAVQGTLPERAQYVLVEQWTVDDSRKTAAYCVYYFSDDATVPGQAWQVARWLTVLWVHPEPERLPGDRM